MYANVIQCDDTVPITVIETTLDSGSCTVHLTHLHSSTRQTLFFTFYTQARRHSVECGNSLKMTHVRSSSWSGTHRSNRVQPVTYFHCGYF